MDLKELALKAVNHFGVDHQREKAIEELSELVTELSREQDKRTSKEKVAEELADVIIMCEQLKIIYNTLRVDRWIREKADRLEEMISPPSVPKGYGSPDRIEEVDSYV